MTPRTDQEKAEFTDDDNDDDDDDVLDDDMEALRRACMITGENPNDLINNNNPSPSLFAAAAGDDSDDDLELVRNIQNRFSNSNSDTLSLKPLRSLPPIASDDDEDDFETLRAIQQRFAAYDSDTLKQGIGFGGSLSKPQQQVDASSLSLEKETSNNLIVHRSNSSEGFTDSEDFCNTRPLSENLGIQPSSFVENHQLGASKSPMLPLKKSSFPKSALLLMDAIKKNRSSQKFIRSQLVNLEARIEENKKLKERVKILKDFQASCKKRTGRALSQRKDPRVQLISVKKSLVSKDSKVNDKRVHAMYYGPAENSHVTNYRMALTTFPLSLDQKKWSKAERENLGKGIRQQFQEMVLQISVDQFSDLDGSCGDSNDFDKILVSIKDLEVTPENLREFLPKVNWEQLASMYVVGRSGAECEVRWLNYEDPLINHNPWTTMEDKNLLLLVQEKGIINWFDIAVSLGTNRTPFQCLARYQRSLNASILKGAWTKDEDAQLCAAVEVFGESDWQSVASTLEGRAGTQCSNRWKKSLHPARERVGRWIEDEDKRLKVAVMLFGPKNWNKIAQFVPGRTQVQCRERWVNSLDPSLSWSEWTEEEDSKLKAAIAEHGYCWAKVAACVPPRTDNQCRRRWKVLLPHEVPMLKEARRIQKAALISNFVDREVERPALGPSDFHPLPMIGSISEPENENSCSKQKGRLRGKATSKEKKNAASCNVPRKIRFKKCEQQSQVCSGTIEKKKHPKPCSKRKKCIKPVADNQSLVLLPESLESGTTNGECVEAAIDNNSTSNKKTSKHCSRRIKCTTDLGGNQNAMLSSAKSMLSGITNDELTLDHVSCLDSTLLPVTNGEVVDSMNEHVRAGKERPTKLQSKRKKCMELAEDSHSFSSHPESGEFGKTDGEGVESSILDMGKGAVKQQKRRKIRNEPSGKCQDVSVLFQQDTLEVSKHRNISSKQILGATNGDDVTLACFLHNKPKKRRLEVAKNTSQACSSSSPKKGVESLSNVSDKLKYGNQNLSTTQDKESQACCLGGNPDELLPCKLQYSHLVDMPTIIDSDNGPDRRHLVQGQHAAHDPVSFSPEGDCEEDGDITLACLLRNKLKKKKGSKLISRVNRHNDGNPSNMQS